MLLERTDVCLEIFARSGHISYKLISELLKDSQDYVDCSFSIAHYSLHKSSSFTVWLASTKITLQFMNHLVKFDPASTASRRA